jgi:two-component system sensor histidine kinase KdpD
LLSGDDGELTPLPAGGIATESSETLLARDALHQRQKRVWALASPIPAEVCYRPLWETTHTFGVLALTRPLEVEFTRQREALADDFADLLLTFCARESLRVAREREQVLAQSEKLARSLLECASHELNTPLTVIHANTLLLTGAASGVSAEVVAEMRGACQRLRQSVANLLDQARLESGVVKPRFDWYDIQDVVRLAVAGVQEAPGAHPHTIDLPANLPPFWIDSTLMLHVLTNLLQNAARYTPDGTAITISGRVDEESRRVYLSVADQGPGIPAELQGQLFQKFRRGRPTGPGGLGLGLSIVRGFVSAQGGEVAVENCPTGGAVFRISFPLNVPPGEPMDE